MLSSDVLKTSNVLNNLHSTEPTLYRVVFSEINRNSIEFVLFAQFLAKVLLKNFIFIDLVNVIKNFLANETCCSICRFSSTVDGTSARNEMQLFELNFKRLEP